MTLFTPVRPSPLAPPPLPPSLDALLEATVLNGVSPKLQARNLRMLTLYRAGWSYVDIAKDVGISKQRPWQILRDAVKVLNAGLKSLAAAASQFISLTFMYRSFRRNKGLTELQARCFEYLRVQAPGLYEEAVRDCLGADLRNRLTAEELFAHAPTERRGPGDNAQ